MLLLSLLCRSTYDGKAAASAKLCRSGGKAGDCRTKPFFLRNSLWNGFDNVVISSDRNAPAMLARRSVSLLELLQASLSSMSLRSSRTPSPERWRVGLGLDVTQFFTYLQPQIDAKLLTLGLTEYSRASFRLTRGLSKPLDCLFDGCVAHLKWFASFELPSSAARALTVHRWIWSAHPAWHPCDYLSIQVMQSSQPYCNWKTE